jgi:hypothetical protein
MSKAQDDFYAIDTGKLVEFTENQEKYDPLTAVKIMRQENAFFYMSDVNSGGDGVPVKNIPGTLYQDIQKYLLLMQDALRLAEIETGFSMLTLGATPDNNTPVKTSMASLQSSSTSMSYIMNSVIGTKAKLAGQIIPMVSNLLEIDPRAVEYYSSVIGGDDVQTIIENKKSLEKLGMKMYPVPTDDLKDRLMQNVAMAVQAGLIDPISAFTIDYQLSRGGNVMEVMRKVQYMIRQEKDRITKEKQLMIQEQGAANERAAKAEADSNERIKSAQMELEASKEKQKTTGALLEGDQKFMNDVKTEVVKDKLEKGEDPTQIIATFEKLINERKAQLLQNA